MAVGPFIQPIRMVADSVSGAEVGVSAVVEGLGVEGVEVEGLELEGLEQPVKSKRDVHTVKIRVKNFLYIVVSFLSERLVF